MIAPTLFDVEAITGFRPIGEAFDPILETTTDVNFGFDRASFKNYIAHHREKITKEVSYMKHISFSNLWLSYYFFCSSSLQIANKYIILATRLYERSKHMLGKITPG